MAQLSVADLHAILSGKPVPTPAPAPERGAREPDPVYYLLAPSLKRPAEASPHVSPEKPRAAESVEIEDELDPEDGDTAYSRDLTIWPRLLLTRLLLALTRASSASTVRTMPSRATRRRPT